MKKIAIIDYKMSNLFSVKHALVYLGYGAEITSDSRVIAKADGVILPGVGAFGDAMKQLKALKLITAIRKYIASGKPFMGVCLGMQLLMDESDEFGMHRGLGIIKGTVTRIPSIVRGNRHIRVPHTGWNTIQLNKGVTTDLLENNMYVYFVHSYYCIPQERAAILSVTNHDGFSFCSSVRKMNVFAVQFHPEKSGKTGILIYKNFFHSL